MTENVVIVVVDALRADRVGCIDTDRKHLTPNINNLAEDGTVFPNAFACAPNTDPSVTSIMTGRYPLNTVYHHGRLVTEQEKRRIEAVVSLPQILSSKGFNSVQYGQSLGRWHTRGFDSYPKLNELSVVGSKDRFLDFANRCYTWLDSNVQYVSNLIKTVHKRTFEKTPGHKEDYSPLQIFSEIDSKPFFGFIHLMDTHAPYLAKREDIDDLAFRYPEEEHNDYRYLLSRSGLTTFQENRVAATLETYGLDEPYELFAAYDAAVKNADRKVGDLVRALKDRELYEDTALFVMSDHGESILENDIFLDHHGLHDPVIHVPLVTNLGSGESIEEFVQLIDVAPTILDVLDLDGEVEMDGRSLLPLIEGDDSVNHRYDAVFAEEGYTERRTAVRTERWKYVKHVPDEVLEKEWGSSLECGYCEMIHGECEIVLYDLFSDRNEEYNVADEHPEAVEALEEKYQAFVEGLIPPMEGGSSVEYETEDELFDRLEALGYR